MSGILHITSGDIAGDLLRGSGLEGEVFVWHDILYDGPRIPGWPDEPTIEARAEFLEGATGGGLDRALVKETLRAQYAKLAGAGTYARIVLWFDACLFDQSMLAHVLACLSLKKILRVDLLCVDAFPGISPFDGLGQLTASQLASLYERRKPVKADEFRYAREADEAFASQKAMALAKLALDYRSPLPWMQAAAARWLEEQSEAATGLGRLERLALEAIGSGRHSPAEIFKAVSAADSHPQYWGDTTLWAKINGLADRRPPLVRIEGPAPRLPQWPGGGDLRSFRVENV